MKKVYIFRQRIFFKGVANVFSVWVWNAATTEKMLHRLFKRRRFTMKKGTTPPVPPFAFNVKIGIAEDVGERQREISANISGSGRTEWFLLPLPHLILAIAVLVWKGLEPLILGGVVIWGILKIYGG